MPWTRSVLTVAMLCLVVGSLRAAQDVPAKNPLEGNADAIRAGMGLFRGRCGDCHGIDARGVRGPDITLVWTSGRTDAGLSRPSRIAFRGQRCPRIPVSDPEIWQSLPICARWPLRPRPTRRAATPRTAIRCFRHSAPPVIESTALAGALARISRASGPPDRAR